VRRKSNYIDVTRNTDVTVPANELAREFSEAVHHLMVANALQPTHSAIASWHSDLQKVFTSALAIRAQVLLKDETHRVIWPTAGMALNSRSMELTGHSRQDSRGKIRLTLFPGLVEKAGVEGSEDEFLFKAVVVLQ